MLHERRFFHCSEVETAELLAEWLTERTWTTCSAFYLRGRGDVVFANDSTSADGAQEYAVFVRAGNRWRQVESIAFGWCTHEEALGYIRRALAGEMTEFAVDVEPRFETSEEHRGRACCA